MIKRVGNIMGVRTTPLERPPPSLPRTLTESDDMMVILNARGTAMLNTGFRNTSLQKQIVMLASLAIRLWLDIPLRAHGGCFRFTGHFDDDGKAWMASHLILMIRDDIQQLLKQGAEYLVDAEQTEQMEHFRVFKLSYVSWQKTVNRRIAKAGPLEHSVQARDDYPVLMEQWRVECEVMLKQVSTTTCPPVCRTTEYTWNRFHDNQAEWVGPVFCDLKSAWAPTWVSLPRIEKRDDEFWFTIDADDWEEVPVTTAAEIEAGHELAGLYQVHDENSISREFPES
jgi:hypothetical protein